MSQTKIRQVPAQQIRMKKLVARHIWPYIRLAAACAAVSCIAYGLIYLFAGKKQPGMWLFIIGAGMFLFIVLLAILLYAFPLDWLRIVYQQRVLGQKLDENQEPFLSPKRDIFYNAKWFIGVNQYGRLVLLNRDFIVQYEECRKQRVYRSSIFWYKVKIQTNCGHMRVWLSSQRSADLLRQWIRGSIAMEPAEASTIRQERPDMQMHMSGLCF